MANLQLSPSVTTATTTAMTIVVKNDIRACFSTGQVVINLSRHPPEQRKKKMDMALSTFREYGWEIDDQREQMGGDQKSSKKRAAS